MSQFGWLAIYKEIAETIVATHITPKELLLILRSIESRGLPTIALEDRDESGTSFPLQEIDPFTFFATWNRQINTQNRLAILQQVKELLNLQSPLPLHFDGIPLVSNMNSWFFSYSYVRKEEDIQILWRLFKVAVEEQRLDGSLFEKALTIRGIKNNLTMGLFWVAPDTFLSLESVTRHYLHYKGIEVDTDLLSHPYEEVMREVRKKLQMPFYEVAYNAWIDSRWKKDSTLNEDSALYTVIIEEQPIEMPKEQRGTNQILYGPPGTGKTYHTVDKTIAITDPHFYNSHSHNRKALKNRFDELLREGRVGFITFHQSLSYEDFVEGIKPKSYKGNVVYTIEDGLFKKMAKRAEMSAAPFVLILDEINRGNIAKIFGELITLIEPSKRKGASEELEVILPYSKEHFSVPQNLHIIGTMNSADRSIALMDMALRRRFTFREMSPDVTLLSTNIEGINLQKLLEVLNKRISFFYDDDHQIGHSYLMDIGSKEELDLLFTHTIIPLLKELFYGEWDKVQMVLGDFSQQRRDLLDRDRFVVALPQIEEQILGFSFADEEVIHYQINKSFSTTAYTKIYE